MKRIFYYLCNSYEELAVHSPEELWSKYEGNKLKNISNETKKLNNVECISAYSQDYIYFLLKCKQEKIINRDRAYQNGDGFHFVIAKPQNDGMASHEFYVIGVSPLNDNDRRIITWYKDINIDFKVLRESEIEYKILNGYTYFTVKINWKDIEPYKPYIYGNYGFNISYVQAVRDEKEVFILKDDEGIQEEESLREYEIFEFEYPNSDFFIIDVDKCNLKVGEFLNVIISKFSLNKEEAKLKLYINDKELKEENITFVNGINKIEIPIRDYEFNKGKNKIKILIKLQEMEKRKDFNITLYDEEELHFIKSKIDTLKSKTSSNSFIKESLTSIEFYYKELKDKIRKLKSYEEFNEIEKSKEILYKSIEEMEKGNDLFKVGYKLRLGFRANVDSTLQAYSLYIPSSCKDNRIIGLMVCLHGSGSDDISVLSNELYLKIAEEQRIILLAPLARGKSNCYCPVEAIEDTIDITKRIKKLFNLENKITILQGFSMGGYGALRIFDYKKEIFQGVAIFSGHYDLGKKFGFIDAKNYIEDNNIKAFEYANMIIYHGEEDLNCNYNEVQKFIDKLKNVNLRLEVKISKCGHKSLTEEWYNSFKSWIETIDKDIILETNRLILRNFKDDDLDILCEYRNDINCSRYQSWSNTSREYLRNFIKNEKVKTLNSSRIQLAIANKNTKELLGDIYIAFKNKTITLGYTISTKNQRRGYAYEILQGSIEYLFNIFPEYEIVCMVHPENKASKNLLKKLDFKNEGYEEQINSIIYSMKR